ncbi:MAG: segregation/condensation protein A [Methylococcaceae bacterium]|nr:segregation/condensation protein A [Methylococcaceae bacterium]
MADPAILESNPEVELVAVVRGTPFTKLPADLYIPPDALEVFLETFEGPLDLLLYLIKRQNLDILDIPVASITHQYVSYIEMMNEMRIELAAEYLVMAAMLAEIKSRMLLPVPKDPEDEDEDPRAGLIRRLQEYERFRNAAGDLDALPREGRDVFPIHAGLDGMEVKTPKPSVDLKELLLAFQEVLKRAEQVAHHHISREPLSVRERMSLILDRLSHGRLLRFSDLFSAREGRPGAVVSFLAVLELCKEGLIEIIQFEPLAELQVKTV